MFICPSCNTPVSRIKAFIIQRNTIIQCKQCQTLLKPDSDTTRKIRFWGGLLIGALAVTGFQLAGIAGAGITAVVGYGTIAVITIKTTRFYIVD